MFDLVRFFRRMKIFLWTRKCKSCGSSFKVIGSLCRLCEDMERRHKIEIEICMDDLMEIYSRIAAESKRAKNNIHNGEGFDLGPGDSAVVNIETGEIELTEMIYG